MYNKRLKKEVAKSEAHFCLSYRTDVEKGKIEDIRGRGSSCFIQTQLNSEEQWAIVLKFMHGES